MLKNELKIIRNPDIGTFEQIFTEESSIYNEFLVLHQSKDLIVSYHTLGTSQNSNLPCIKLEFMFDPQLSLDDVIQSLQIESRRRSWDPFIKTSKVIHTSESGRLQIVYTQYKEQMEQAPRHFFEKKLHFSVSEES